VPSMTVPPRSSKAGESAPVRDDIAGSSIALVTPMA